MTGNPVKSRFVANFIEKKRSIFDSEFENKLFRMLFLCPWKGGKWIECLEALVLLGF